MNLAPCLRSNASSPVKVTGSGIRLKVLVYSVAKYPKMSARRHFAPFPSKYAYSYPRACLPMNLLISGARLPIPRPPVAMRDSQNLSYGRKFAIENHEGEPMEDEFAQARRMFRPAPRRVGDPMDRPGKFLRELHCYGFAAFPIPRKCGNRFFAGLFVELNAFRGHHRGVWKAAYVLLPRESSLPGRSPAPPRAAQSPAATVSLRLCPRRNPSSASESRQARRAPLLSERAPFPEAPASVASCRDYIPGWPALATATPAF